MKTIFREVTRTSHGSKIGRLCSEGMVHTSGLVWTNLQERLLELNATTGASR